MLAELSGLLMLLHILEGAAGGERIGPLSETLLDEIAAAGSPEAAAKVDALRTSTRRKKTERAARNRAKMMAACGIAQVSRCILPHLQPCSCTALLITTLTLSMSISFLNRHLFEN